MTFSYIKGLGWAHLARYFTYWHLKLLDRQFYCDSHARLTKSAKTGHVGLIVIETPSARESEPAQGSLSNFVQNDPEKFPRTEICGGKHARHTSEKEKNCRSAERKSDADADFSR